MPNPPKLVLEYPCIRFIKGRMRHNDEINENQLKNFDRRVRNSPFILTIVQYAEHQFNRAKIANEKLKKVNKELDRIEKTPFRELERENERLTEGMLRLRQENEDLKQQLKKAQHTSGKLSISVS